MTPVTNWGKLLPCSPSSANAIGIPYILMSKAQGTPLSAYDWPWFTGVVPHQSSTSKLRPLSDAGKENVMRQLGELVYELSRLRLDGIGSLFEDGGGYVIRESLTPAFVWKERDYLDINRGPFNQEAVYFEALIAATRLHAQELPMGTHLFSSPIPTPSEFSSWASYLSAANRWNDFAKLGGKIDSGKNRLDYCIVSDLLKEMIPKFNRGIVSGVFAICHPDLSVNNIFVDDDLNITCIIDWSFATSIPFVELLAVPGMPYPRCHTDPSLVVAFKDGFEGKGGTIASQLWEDSEKIWHFQRLVFMDSLQDYHHFEELYNLVYAADRPTDDIAALFRQQYAIESNQKELVHLSEEDQCAADVEREERKYFSSYREAEVNREAVARKLTVMAQLNPAMVADRRLWHWIERIFGYVT